MPKKPKTKAKRPRKGFDLNYGLDWDSDQTPIPRHLTFNITSCTGNIELHYTEGQNEQ